MTLLAILTFIHIIAGSISLAAAALAVSSAKGKTLHRNAGGIYFWGMVGIFLTAIPMAILTSNIFLFLVALFSFYLAFSGRRFAKNRTGTPHIIDWIAIAFMLTSGFSMLLLSLWYFLEDNSRYIVLVVFGLLAIVLGYRDFATFKNGNAIGKMRIARHLTNMLGGTIAVITAVLVVNVSISPTWVWWILPTVLISPVIAWWSRKTLA